MKDHPEPYYVIGEIDYDKEGNPKGIRYKSGGYSKWKGTLFKTLSHTGDEEITGENHDRRTNSNKGNEIT